MNIVFAGTEHQSRWVEIMKALGKVYGGKFDQEYGAALYILTSDKFTWEKAEDYVQRTGIDFEAILSDVDWSGGYVHLILLAGNLFNGSEHVDPLEFMRLDERNPGPALWLARGEGAMMEAPQLLDRSEQVQLIAIFQTFLSLPNASGLQLYFYADTSGGLIKHGKTKQEDKIVYHWHDMEEGAAFLEGYKQELQEEAEQ